MGFSLPSTPPASALSLAPARRGQELTASSKQRSVSVATPTPSLRARRAATSLCSLSRLVAAGVPSPKPSSGSLRGRELSVRTLPFGRLCVRRMRLAGAASSPSLRRGPSPALCFSSPSTPSPLLPASRLCMRSCKTNAGCTPLPPAASRRGPRLLAQRRLQVHWDRARTEHKKCVLIKKRAA